MNKDMLKQCPKGGICPLDPVLNLFININSLREVATEVRKVLDYL